MCLCDVGIQLDAIAGLVLDGEVAVLPERAFANHQVRPPVDPFGQFVDAELPHGGGRVTGGDGPHRTGGVVACGPDVVQVGEIRDLLRFQQTAGFRNVDVDAGG